MLFNLAVYVLISLFIGCIVLYISYKIIVIPPYDEKKDK